MNPQEEFTAILAKLSELNKTHFPSLVWLWVWNVIDEFYNDEELYLRYQNVVWDKLNEDTPSFTLEFGTEHLYEHVRDWMFDNSLMIDMASEDDETIQNWCQVGPYVQGR